MKQILKPNFHTASECEAFQITSQMLQEVLETAKSNEREYAWSPLEIDYWLYLGVYPFWNSDGSFKELL